MAAKKTPAAPKSTTSTPAQAPAAPAPASPWAPGAAGANPDPAANAPAGAEPTAGPEAATGNGGGTTLGEDAPRGDIFDEQGNVLQSRDNTSDTVSQPPKAPDNEPTVEAGGDAGALPRVASGGAQGREDKRPELSDLRDELGDLSEEEEAQFRAVIEDTARTELNRIRRNRKAKEIEVSLVDGSQHFGTLAIKATEDSARAAEEAGEGDADEEEEG